MITGTPGQRSRAALRTSNPDLPQLSVRSVTTASGASPASWSVKPCSSATSTSSKVAGSRPSSRATR